MNGILPERYGMKYLARRFIVFFVLLLLLISSIVKAQDHRPIVVLFPGHGWWNSDLGKINPGVVSDDLVDKDINLEVTQYTQRYLTRCPGDVFLTRDQDDQDHTLSDVDEIVNTMNPAIGISIHTNSFGGEQTGTEGCYTIDGYNDQNSKLLAALLAKNIYSRLGIRNIGTKPETQSRYGGLYIHHWNAPSALIEIAEIHGDANLFRNQIDDFGRSIAQAVLEYFEIVPHCADWTEKSRLIISTYYPEDRNTNELLLKNDSLLPWRWQDFQLIIKNKEYGAESRYFLSHQMIYFKIFLSFSKG